jgi:hypothetical protein
LSNYLTEKPANQQDFVEECEDLSCYYKLEFDTNNIKFIDKQIDFENFLSDLSETEETVYVGVDSEWKPTCTGNLEVESKLTAALMQIATRQFIYLLDINALCESLKSELFAAKFLYNKNIIKIGYGFTQDIHILARTFNINDVDAFKQTILDLGALTNQVIDFFILENLIIIIF